MKRKSFKKIATHSLLLTFLLLFIYLVPGNLTISAYATSSVTTYAQPTGVTASDKFSCRIYDGSTWYNSFTYKTGGNLYYSNQTGLTNSFTSFEFSGGPITVEITATNETAISSYRISPASLGVEATVNGNTLSFNLVPSTLSSTRLVVEVNDSTTHVMSVFANDPLENAPSPTGTGVYAVEPGTTPPTTGTWTTLYFKPGVHDIGKSFPVYANKDYYIAGGAVVKGTFTNIDDYTGITYSSNTSSAYGKYHAVSNTKIWGYGIISGEDYPWTDDDPDDFPNRPISLAFDFDEIEIEGITIMDPALHSMCFWGNTDLTSDVTASNVKVISWKRNGDAININGDGVIEDCFFRVSDDGPYIKKTQVRNCVLWIHDIGNVFVISGGGGDSVVEDCQIIYYGQNTGNDMAVFRDKFGASYTNRVFKNIIIENNYYKKRIYQIIIENDLSATDITFENIMVENMPTSVYNASNPQVSYIRGESTSANVDGFTFVNNQCEGTDSGVPMFLINTTNFTFSSSDEYNFSTDFNKAQGIRGWYYKYGTTTYSTLVWGDRWRNPSLTSSFPAIIACTAYDGMMPSDSEDAVLEWMAPKDGTINISAEVKKYESGGNGVQVKIMKNSTQVWPSSGWQDIAYNDLTGVSHDFDVSVETGDSIYFIVNSKSSNSYDWTIWDPTITY